MLLYDEEAERSSAEIECINHALAAGQYCVYATVDACEKDFISRISQRIPDYARHIEDGNLRIIDFSPFYTSAATGDLRLFDELKAQVEKAIDVRAASGRTGKCLLVADAACYLTKHRQFDECVTLESWWQDTYNEWMALNLDISIICAHPSSMLKHESHKKQQDRISQVHSLTLDLGNLRQGGHHKVTAETPVLRILIVEPERDICTMYMRYLRSLPVEVDTATGGKECLERLAASDSGLYDIIILDTHLKDASGFHIARKIVDDNPDQQIVFTTTWDLNTISSDIRAHALQPEKYPVLQKPFVFSQMLGYIKPAKAKIEN